MSKHELSMRENGRRPVRAAITTTLFAVLGGFALAAAAEGGSFDALSSSVNLLHTIDRSEGRTVIGGYSSGTLTITRSDGAVFEDGASLLAECIPLIMKGPSSLDLQSHCTFALNATDKLFGLFRRQSGDIAAGTGGKGRLELVGGTGRYAGVSASCPYTTSYLPDNHVVTNLHCQWRR